MRNTILLLSIALFAYSAAAQIPVSAPLSNMYLLAPGDQLTGKVVGESDYDFVTEIDPNGNIIVPFSEMPIPAKCKSEEQLRTDLKKVLGNYLRNPQLSLRVSDRKGRPPVTVYGEVKTQQQVILVRETHLAELIAFSGGVTDDAGGLIQVFRTTPPVCSAGDDDSKWTSVTSDPTDVPSRMFNLASVKQGKDEANPAIYPGDVIVVQRAAPVYVTGEVRNPQGVYLKEGGMTLYEVVAKLGGPNREAKTKDIKIYRMKEGSKDREIISANYDLIKKGQQKDVELKPYDIIEVDKAKDSVAKQILSFALGTGKAFVQSVTSTGAYRILY